jgi:cobalamin biosynthesis Mg chelatase CobN
MSDVTITYAKANDNTASLDKNPSTGKDKVNQGSSVSVADSSVNTGDSMPLLPLMIIMILAVVVIIVVIVLSIRARRK